MADQRTSIFQPLTAQDLQGPFSGFLTPPTPSQTTQNQPPPASTLGGLAQVATSFIEGATKGRIRAYEERENQKQASIASLNSYVTQVLNNPNLTDEAKQLASQQYYRAMGANVLDAAGKSGGKGKGGGKGDQQPGDLKSHFTNILKDIATGMVGGKMPKGAPDVGGTLANIQSQIFNPDGTPKQQYDRQGQIKSTLSGMEQTIKDKGFNPESSTQEEVLAALGQQVPNLRRLAGADADQHLGDILGRFQRAPQMGTTAWAMRQWDKQRKQPQESGAAPPPGPANVRGMIAAPPPGQAAPAESQAMPQAAPQGRVMSGRDMMLLEMIPGAVGDFHNFEIVGKDGKLEPIGYGRVITDPNTGEAGLYDASNRLIPVDPTKLRQASTTQPRQVTYQHDIIAAPHDMTLTDGTKVKKGEAVRYRLANEEGAKIEYLGKAVAHPIAPRGGGAGFNIENHPQVMTARLKNRANAIIGQMISQTKFATDMKSQDPNMHLSFPEYLLKVSLPQSYLKNFDPKKPEDMQTLAYVRQGLESMAKGEKLTTKEQMAQMLTSMRDSSQAEYDQTRSQVQMDHIQQQVDDGFNELFGAQQAAPPPGGETPWYNQ